ncbi:hypothetical protein SMD20_39690 [Nonomuraea sp. LP-02]|uniref:hypothetical protein n=1 Tax=Nonomuraea sp. LP-02 TaxID=3097960 RepID=UPI002E35AC83|nr:hypothetical protein [Nonomuraea sp. LP-02]MED7930405.1 hypothetical protein [Nonomuraea sp. LP-02]
MTAIRRPDGIYPYIGTEAYAERLADAIENTCIEQEVTPPPRDAIIEGLATTLGNTEIKKLLTSQRGKKILAPHAYRIVQAGQEKVLLLTCDVHGAGIVPWDLNDRTAGAWTTPDEEAMQRVRELVAAEVAMEQADKDAKLAEKERDARRRTGDSQPHAAAALAAADDKLRVARKAVAEAQRECERLLSSLGNRRPRPAVRPAEHNGQPAAAFTLAPQPQDVAVHLQRYAVESLRRAGRRRGYNLIESLVASGQLSRGTCALQQWQIQQPDGQITSLWRMVAVTANNRTLARLDIYGVHTEHLVTGMPQHLCPMTNDKPESTLLLLNMREILNRISVNLNTVRAKEDAGHELPAHRAAKITTVPTDIVIGCSNPAALEHVLRTLNVDDHLRGIQPYDEDARLIALWAILVDAYVTDERLVPALSDAFPDAKASDRLNVDAVRAALTANGPLDPLAPLLPMEEIADPIALRDIAIRSITALVFPDLPPAPPETGRRQVRDTGPNWPIVRGALQEPAWSQISAKAAVTRTRLWSAAVAQLFLQRGNILSATGLFGVSDVKEGARQDPRSVRKLLLKAEAGDSAAWSALVDRIVPNLIHAPEPLVTPGQGSEAGDLRKGTRRSPSSAVAALKMAYTRGAPAVTRELLIAFAKEILSHPDASSAPEAPDGTTPVCYGEQNRVPENRTPIVPGMILVPDSEGNPTNFLVDKAWFDEIFGPDMAPVPNRSEGGGDEDEESGWFSSGNSGPESVMRVAETIATSPRTQLSDLRRELPARIEVVAGSYEHAVQSADALLNDFETARQLRIDLEEQTLSADQRIEWMEKLTKARSAAEASIAALQQVEALILQL